MIAPCDAAPSAVSSRHLTRCACPARCARLIIRNRSYVFDVPDPRSDQDPFARVHRHHHDGSAQEGPAECLAARIAPAAAGTEAAGRTGLFLASPALAPRSGPARPMV